MEELNNYTNAKIISNLEEWKKKLLDLSKRNNIIFFKYNKKYHIKINNEIEDVFQKLLQSNKKVNIGELNLEYDMKSEEERMELNKILYKLRIKSNSVLKEKGINILYLCFGMLKWRESDDSNIDIYSPLILAPISIIKKSKDTSYCIESIDKEYDLNKTLMFKMKNDFGLEFQNYKFDESFQIENYLKFVKEKIKNLKKWDVISEIYLGTFSFSKISLYNDLGKYREHILKHDIVNKIASGNKLYNLSEYENIKKTPLQKKSKEIFQILDADSSQQQAIEIAKKGYSFVIEGPPGTGKSQTIANIIAEALAQSKKILFVSEKVAALEVVFKRLNLVGLGNYVLELHSNKANKKQVISSLYSQLLSIKRENYRKNTLDFIEFDRNVEEINNYVQALHLKYKPLNKSAFDFYGELSKISNVKDVNFKFDNISDFTLEKVLNLKNVVKELEFKHNELEQYKKSLWKTCLLDSINIQKEKEIVLKFDEFKELINQIISFKKDLKEINDINIKTINQLLTYNNAVEKARDISYVNFNWFNKELLDDIEKVIFQNIDIQQSYFNYFNQLKKNYNEDIKNETQINEIKCLKEFHNNLSNEYKKEFYNEKTRLEIYQTLDCFKEQIIQIENLTPKLNHIFGESNNIDINDLKKLASIISLISKGSSVSKKWIEDRRFIEKLLEYKLIKIKQEHIQTNEKIIKLEPIFNDEIYKSDINNIVHVFNNDSFMDRRINAIYSNINQLSEHCERINSSIEKIKKYSIELFNFLGINKEVNISTIILIVEIIDLIDNTKYCKKEWLSSNKILFLKKEKEKLKKSKFDLINKIQNVNEVFKESISNIDFEEMYSRFNNEYISKFRFLNFKFRKDKKILSMHVKNTTGRKLTYEVLYEYLEKLYLLRICNQNFEKYEEKYSDEFGVLYSGIDTDFEEMDYCIDNIESFIKKYNEIGKNETLEKMLIEKNDIKQILDLKNKIDIELKELKNEIEIYGECYSDIKDFNLKDINKISLYLKTEQQYIFNIVKLVKSINIFKKVDIIVYDDFVKYLNLAFEIQKDIAKLNSNKDIFEEMFGVFYNGLKTDWDKVECLLNWTKEVQQESKKLTSNQKENLNKYIFEDLNNDLNNLKNFNQNLNLSLFEVNQSIDKFIKLKNYKENDIKIIKEKYNALELKILKNIVYNLLKSTTEINIYIQRISDFKDTKFVSTKELFADLELIQNLLIIKQKLELLDKKNKDYFSEKYLDFNTDWQDILNNFSSVKQMFETENFTFIISETFAKNLSNGNKLNKLIEDNFIEDIKINFNSMFEYLKTLFSENIILKYNNTWKDLSFDEFLDTLDILQNQIKNLDLIIEIRRIIKDSEKLKIDRFVREILTEEKIENNIIDIFNKKLYTALLDDIYFKNDILKRFHKSKYQRYIKEFKIKDKEIIDENSNRINYILKENAYEILKTLIEEEGILEHENSKKKRHIPLRTLFARIPNLILNLKPCIMMSPLTVSEFIDLKNMQFDLVIFDEASQICPEDAIGAMIRGKQIIVAGDNKQLPPTKFFDNMYDEEDYDDDQENKFEKFEFESILDLCNSVLYKTRLLWHYRSRHESLIAFSNKHFYDNALYTFPSPSNTDNMGVKFSYVEDGAYDRSGSRTNIKEAKFVAELVFNHIRENSSRSLGVITFSTSQMECVINMIEQKRRECPEFEEFFNENKEDSFFVKNLENVQGDERDTIILSVGYGFTEENRKTLSHNFGPLNKAGGERRLNVAITRAKYQLHLVASIKDSDINLNKTQSVGVRLLKSYIEFAKLGKMPINIEVSCEKEFDSPLEEDIYDEIVKLGYEVDTQVGCSGYRIDLAIKEFNNNSYILGVECDGATYHSSRSARDRDRLRQEVLEGLGWKIYRIWSQDWFRRKDDEINRLKNYLEDLNKVKSLDL